MHDFLKWLKNHELLPNFLLAQNRRDSRLQLALLCIKKYWFGDSSSVSMPFWVGMQKNFGTKKTNQFISLQPYKWLF
jgi:hypothetical protein